MKLYIVRHGKTDWNIMGLLQGQTNIELNEEGINDARKLSKEINLNEIDLCISSSLERAKQTAEILTNNKTKIIYDDMIVERGFGDYEGKKINYDLIENQWNYKLNDSSNNIENIEACLIRAKTFLDKIKKEYPNKEYLPVEEWEVRNEEDGKTVFTTI